MAVVSRVRPGLGVVSFACAAALGLSGCGGSSAGGAQPGGDEPNGGIVVSAVDGPVYETVEALTANAEVVVLGAVGSVRGTEVDDGGTEGGDGIEVTFSSVTVDEVLAGRATLVQAGDVLAVGVFDEPSELGRG